MFQTLIAQPQEVMHKRHLVYCVHMISVGCNTIEVTTIVVSLTHAIYQVPLV
jgi:hypothetical protein